MIIHAATVELHPTDVRLLQDSGLLPPGPGATPGPVFPVGRADLASRLALARTRTNDPQQRAIIGSFLRLLRV